MSVAYYDRIVQEDINVGVGVTSKRNPGGGTLAATQVGIHTFGVNQEAITQSWSPGSIANGASATTTVTYSGATVGDFVLRSFNADVQGLQLTADVTDTSTVTLILSNLTGAALDIGTVTVKVLVLKSI